ncbi:MLO-like protein [Vigna angularis]|uniref:MLO-like protein n=1 Tax=Phaseolus angularis TaxID=3914 RepID=A0A8T0JFA0_PHAAN|nr:MLO-like protein [Vigna angularis]
MAGSGGRNLDETPTWAVATVCFVLLSVSIIIEYIFNLIGKRRSPAIQICKRDIVWKKTLEFLDPTCCPALDSAFGASQSPEIRLPEIYQKIFGRGLQSGRRNQIVLLVGMKLQVIITKMGQRIQERGEVVRGMPLVQPGDHLFWFNKPRLILYLINFVLFQMGSTMKATIFNERVAMALRNWHHTAKKNIKEKRGLRSQSPLSTRPSTPKHPKSKANLLRRYHSEMATYPSSPIRFDFEAHLPYEIHSPPSSKVNAAATSSIDQHEMEMEVEMEIDMDQVSDLAQHQIDIEDKQEFSFDKR